MSAFIRRRAALALPVLVFGAAAAGADPVNPLETILVSATRAESTRVAVPKAITVIDRAEIERSSARHVVDLLRGRGGLQVSDLFGDGSEARVDLRGFGATATDNTLVLVDGRRLNNADLGEPDLNSVKLADVERVEIVYGSAATLYGDKAVGGVINIITRRPDRLRAQLALDAGSYGRRALNAAFANRHANGVGYRLSAERRLSDGYRDNSDQQYSNLHGEIDFSHAGGRLFAEYARVDENRDTPGPLFRDQIRADRRQALNPRDFIDTDTEVLRLGVRQALPLGFELQAEYTNRGSDSEGILSTFGFANDLLLKRRHTEVTPRVVGALALPAGTAALTVGADLLRTDYTLISDVGATRDEQVQVAVYAQAVIPLHRTVDLTAGARHAEVDNELFASTTFLGVSLPPGSEIDDDAEAAEIGLSWRPRAGLRLFARAERNFRFPNADEFSGIANFNVFPFPAPLPLPQAQTGTSWDLGGEWRAARAALSVVLYQLDIDDEIAFEPVTGQNFNVGDSRRRGLSLQASWAPRPRLRLDAGYGLVDGQMTSGAFDGRDITFVARHSGRVSAWYRFTGRLSGTVDLTGVSARVLAGDFDNTLPALGGYVVADLELAWQGPGLRVAARVGNLLDRQYSDAGSLGFDFRQPFFPVVPTWFPAPERNFLLSVSYRYE